MLFTSGTTVYLPMMSTAPYDIPPYLVRIQQGMAGSLLYRSPFGGWEVWEAGAFPVNILYNLWGFLLSPFRPDALLAFHLLRLVAAASFLTAVRLWIDKWGFTSAVRGWVFPIYIGAPMYLLPFPFAKTPDQHILLSLIATPHVTLSLALWLTSLWLVPAKGPAYLPATVLTGWLATLLDPYVGIWIAVWLLAFAVQDRSLRWWRIAASCAAAVPAAYTAWLSTVHALSGYTLNVSPLWLSLATIIPLALALAGLAGGEPGPLRRRYLLTLFFVHLVIAVGAAYIGNRMVIALWPLWVAAFLQALQRLSPSLRWLVTGCSLTGSIHMVALLLLVFSGSLGTPARPLENNLPLGYSAHYMEAVGWLRNQPLGVVMGSPFSTNVLPYLSGQIVWLGHPSETPEFRKKYETLQQFWRWPPHQQQAFCQQERIRWVVLTYHDLDLWPSVRTSLPAVFANRDAIVYQCAD
jgi:hypothetical protein